MPGTGRTSQPRAGTAVRLRTWPRRTTTIQPNGTRQVRCPPGAAGDGPGVAAAAAGAPGCRAPVGAGRPGRWAAQWVPGGPWPGRRHGRRAPWSRAAVALPRFVRWRPPGRRRGPSRTTAGPPGLRPRRRGAAGAAVARPVGRRRRLASAGPAPPRWAALRPGRPGPPRRRPRPGRPQWPGPGPRDHRSRPSRRRRPERRPSCRPPSLRWRRPAAPTMPAASAAASPGFRLAHRPTR